jgi:flagellar motility protein MotE (MotC chaperone)
MPKKKSSRNRKNSTKWRLSVTNLGVSKLFKILLLTVLLKLAVIAGLAWSPERPAQQTAQNGGPSMTAPIENAAQRFGLIAEAAEPAKDASKEAQKDAPKDAQSGKTGAPEQPKDKTKDLPAGSMRDQQKRLDELNRKEQTLRELEKELDAKLVRIQELDAKLQRMLDDASAMKDQKLKHLIDVYSNMKAKQAATVLETLDEKIAVKILAGMRGRQAGEILTYMQAEKAAKLSEQLTKMQIPFQ